MKQQVVPSGNSAVPFLSNSGALSTTLDETFSYEGFPADRADALRKQAARIRHRMTAATEIMIKAVAETGRDLIAVKQHLERGKFCDWVQAECGFTRRTAENYMRVAYAFAETKCETISHLQLSTLYELSAKSTPPELLSLVIKCAGTDQPISDDEVREMLAEAKFQKLEGKRQKERADAARRLSEHVRESREAQERAWDEEQRKTEARALTAALGIIEKLGPEGLRILAPAFEGPDEHLIAQHLRIEIEKIVGKANSAQEAT
jgi:Protein of unknown function (DUF3102)